MNAEDFISRNRAAWDELSGLVARAGGNGIRRMSPADLDRLGDLYRAATSDLALAQRDFAQHPVAGYLNQLVARAHAAIYRGRPVGRFDVARFLGATFPCAFRRLAPFILAAAGLVLIPAAINGVLVAANPDRLEWTLGPDAREVIPVLKRGRLWIDDNLAEQDRPAASAFIMTNNIRVSLTAFAGGASAGLLTVYILLMNGLQLGGLLGLAFHFDLGWRLLNFIAGHGVIEMSVVFMAGGAGLRMGWAIVRPGALARKDALVLAAREGLILAGGATPLLVAAGVIEAFVSPLFNPVYSLLAAVVTGAAMYGWLILGGRAVRAPPSPARRR